MAILGVLTLGLAACGGRGVADPKAQSGTGSEAAKSIDPQTDANEEDPSTSPDDTSSYADDPSSADDDYSPAEAELPTGPDSADAIAADDQQNANDADNAAAAADALALVDGLLSQLGSDLNGLSGDLASDSGATSRADDPAG